MAHFRCREVFRADETLLCRVEFDVSGVYPNSTNTLYVIAGEQCLVVVDAAGERQAEIDLDGLRDVKWHPCGVRDACFTVLVGGSVDPVIHSYFLTPQGLISEVTLLFRETQIEAEQIDPVAMCFGSSASETGSLTLFIASSEGEIYALCPFVPAKFALSSAQLNALQDFAVSAEVEARSADTQESAGNRLRQPRRQLAWVSELVTQAENAVLGWKSKPTVTLTRPTRPSPCIQGPIAMAPYPSELYLQDVFDICSYEVGNGSIPGLALATTDFVVLCVQDAAVPLHWEASIDTDIYKSASLAVVECVPVPGEKRLLASGSVVYAQTDKCVTCLDCVWGKDLLKDFHNISQTDVTQMASLRAVSARISSPQDPDISVQSLSLRDVTAQSFAALENESFVNAQDADEVLSKPRFKEFVARSLPPLPKFIPSFPLSDDVKSLAELDKIAAAFEEVQVVLYQSIGTALQHRELQKAELLYQLERVNEIQESLAKLKPKEIRENIVKCSSRSTALAARVKRLQDRLAKCESAQPVGEQELRWRSELQRLSSRLVLLQRLAAELRSSPQEIQRIYTTEAASAEKEFARLSRLGPAEISALRQQLAKQRSRIQCLQTLSDRYIESLYSAS